MTIFDGHGRTPHDTLEQFLSAVAMICCLPCLCVVAIGKVIPRSGDEVEGNRGKTELSVETKTVKEEGQGGESEKEDEKTL
jgi:hypothetical protein